MNIVCISSLKPYNIIIILKIIIIFSFSFDFLVITPSTGSKIPNFDHYFWSTCREDKLSYLLFMDIHVYFTTSSLNISNSSMCRDIEFYISYII